MKNKMFRINLTSNDQRDYVTYFEIKNDNIDNYTNEELYNFILEDINSRRLIPLVTSLDGCVMFLNGKYVTTISITEIQENQEPLISYQI